MQKKDNNMAIWKKYLLCCLSLLIITISASARETTGIVSGKILSTDGEPIDYASVKLKGTSHSGMTDEKGLYHISAPAGTYTMEVSSVGYEKKEVKVSIKAGERTKMIVKLKSTTDLREVTVDRKSVV